ncbi:MAG: GIY-YIG nuclease family protein [Ferruginibacter sp.]
MSNFTIYILYSKAYNKTYIGFTSNLLQRFKSHNSIGKKGWTIKYRPWVVIYTEFYDDKISAMKKEKFLKSGVGRKWLRDKLEVEYKNNGYISIKVSSSVQ